MRELDCDFCGAQAAGAYEVGPEPPDRSPTQRRRLVLCEDCRVTLTDAIEPLRERLAAAESGGDSAATDSTTSSAATDSATEKSDDPTETDDSGESDPLSEPDRTARNGASPATSGAGSEDSATADSDDSATADNGDTAATSNDDAATADNDDAAATSNDDTADSDQSDSSGGHSEEPPEFRRVMRLLNNRTFPVDRTEFTELATGAYNLDEREVDRIVEYAVERGVLAVESGQLTRG